MPTLMSTARAAATVTMAMTNVPIMGGRRCVLHTAQRSEWFIVGHLAECNKVEGECGMWNVKVGMWMAFSYLCAPQVGWKVSPPGELSLGVMWIVT